MAVSVGVIEALMRLTDEFSGPAKNAEKAASSLESAMGPLGAAFGAVTAGVAGLAAAVALAGAVLVGATAHTLEYAGHLSDLSAKTGVSTDSLQTLAHVGSMVGVSMDDIGSAIGKMQRNLVEGSSAFERLGLSVNTLRAMAPEKAFEEIAAKIASIKDPAGQAAAAIEVFGKSGASLLPAMKENIRALAEEAKRLGFVMSKEMVASADALGDKFTTLNSTWQGFIRNIGSVVTSSSAMHTAVTGITNILGGLSNSVKDNQGALRALVDQGIELAVRGLSLLVKAVGFVVEQFSNAKNVISDWANELVKAAIFANTAKEILSHPLDAGAIWEKARQNVALYSAQMSEMANKELDAQAKRAAAITNVGKQLDNLADQIHKTAGKSVELTEATKKTGPALEFMGKSAGEAAKHVADFESKVSSAEAKLAEFRAKQSGDTVGAAVIQATETARKSMLELGEAYKKAGDFSEAAYAKFKKGQDAILGLQEAQIKAAAFAENMRLAGIATADTARKVDFLRDNTKKLLEEMANNVARVGQQFGTIFGSLGLGKIGEQLGSVAETLSDQIAAHIEAGTANALEKGINLFLFGGKGAASLGAIKAFMAGAQGIVDIAQTQAGGAKGLIAGASAGAAAGAALGPQGALVGAMFGAQFNAGRDRELSTGLKAAAAILTGGPFSPVFLGGLFSRIFGGSQEAAAQAEANALRASAATEILRQRTDSHAAAVDNVKAAMDRWGLTVDQMGSKWSQQQLDEKAMSLFQDYSLLTAAGADHNLVIEKMAPGINEYVNAAIKSGATIPASMQPTIQSMLDMGLLTDDTGEKMTTLGGLTFAETISESVGRLIDKIGLMIDALNDVPNIERTVTITTVGKIIDPDTKMGMPVGENGVGKAPKGEPDFAAADGLHGWFDKPHTVMFGENGPERVDITPEREMRGSSAGGGRGYGGGGGGVKILQPIQLIVDGRQWGQTAADLSRAGL